MLGGTESTVQVGFSYSDGFGREIQKKIQAEKGKVPLRDEYGRIRIDPEGRPVMSDDEREPRWVGSGWTVFNNKGKPIRQYEPFFSDTHEVDCDARIGVSSVLFYDPVERVIATLHPNNTYEKVVFDPWEQKTFDVNDTVKDDPRKDPDISGYVGEYFKQIAPAWKPWLMERIADPDNPPDDTYGHNPEQDSAVRTLGHAGTPTIAYFDTLGRTFMTAADNGVKGKYRTRVGLDIEGNQFEVRDEVTGDGVIQERIVMRYDYYMAGPEQSEEKKSNNLIHQASMEAGERWVLNDVSGKPVRTWDSRMFTRRMTYDQLRRPLCMYVTENGDERLAERTVYGEFMGGVRNLKTRVYQVYDGAGVVTNDAYDFKGNLVRSMRELLTDYKSAVDWSQNPNPALDAVGFDAAMEYDALNRPISVTSPDNSVYKPVYNEANLLDKVSVTFLNVPHPTPFVENIDYNEKGQRTLIAYANGTSTTYAYDRLTFRLTGLKTMRPAGRNGSSAQIFVDPAVVQDLRYIYDPAGNITRREDAAFKRVVNSGENVDPACDYVYDAIYRLVEANGREHVAQSELDSGPAAENRRDYPFLGTRANPLDLQALRNYTERYEYDEAGNFLFLRHLAKNWNWHRSYEYSADSLLEPGTKNNRLTKTEVGNSGNFTEEYKYEDTERNDVHGCMTTINTMKMAWDFKDQLQMVDLGGGGTAYYVYDASGRRVRKVVESETGAFRKERIYIGGYEVYREHNGGTAPKLERETLHVMDDKQRIALVETRTIGNELGVPVQIIRYQFANHLGSACLELDDQAKFISYEEYYPYGSTSFQCTEPGRETPAKRYRYTGKERDEETGLYYYGARYYASWLGRWTSCDPAGLVDGGNLYLYVKGNPIKLIDPFGLSGWDRFWGGVKMAGGVLEAVGGAAIITAGAATSEIGVGIPLIVAGVFVTMHGCDVASSGAMTMLKGEQVDSLSSQGLQVAGMTRTQANVLDAEVSIIGSLGSSAVTRAPSTIVAVSDGAKASQSSVSLAFKPALGPGHNMVGVNTGTGTQWSHLVVDELKDTPKIALAAPETAATVVVAENGPSAAYAVVEVPVAAARAQAANTFVQSQLGPAGQYALLSTDCATYAASVLNKAGIVTLPVTSPSLNLVTTALQSPAAIAPAVNATRIIDIMTSKASESVNSNSEQTNPDVNTNNISESGYYDEFEGVCYSY
jgi:RHS repeat-associated protein